MKLIPKPLSFHIHIMRGVYILFLEDNKTTNLEDSFTNMGGEHIKAEEHLSSLPSAASVAEGMGEK